MLKDNSKSVLSFVKTEDFVDRRVDQDASDEFCHPFSLRGGDGGFGLRALVDALSYPRVRSSITFAMRSASLPTP